MGVPQVVAEEQSSLMHRPRLYSVVMRPLFSDIKMKAKEVPQSGAETSFTHRCHHLLQA